MGREELSEGEQPGERQQLGEGQRLEREETELLSFSELLFFFESLAFAELPSFDLRWPSRPPLSCVDPLISSGVRLSRFSPFPSCSNPLDRCPSLNCLPLTCDFRCSLSSPFIYSYFPRCPRFRAAFFL